jgi:hypothetical protein
MTMSIINPNVLLLADLTSSTAVDAYPVYDPATNYALNERVTYQGRTWESIQTPNTGNQPDTSPLYWLNYAPSNTWNMFDQAVGTITTAVGGLTVVMRPGGVGGLALLELEGKSVTVTMRDAPAGNIIYSKTVVLDGTVVTDFYDWFYAEYAQLTDVVLTDMPVHFVSNELTVSIEANTALDEVSCGICHFGQVLHVGSVQYGATVGIIDYSRKSVDAFGNYSITQRAYSKRADMQLVTQKSDFSRIYRAMASLRSTPCIYIATEAPGYDPLIIYGFYRDFSIDVSYPTTHLCSLSVEGLI